MHQHTTKLLSELVENLPFFRASQYFGAEVSTDAITQKLPGSHFKLCIHHDHYHHHRMFVCSYKNQLTD